MKLIPLTRGAFALVDDEDFEELSKFKWCLLSTGYAVRNIKVDGKKKMELMHRVVNKTPEGMTTDHINENRLDNQKKNLRSCTHSQNLRNHGANKNNPLGIKGVYIYTNNGRKYIRAEIEVEGKTIHVGNFKTVPEALQAHNEAKIKYHGEFANLNTN